MMANLLEQPAVQPALATEPPTIPRSRKRLVQRKVMEEEALPSEQHLRATLSLPSSPTPTAVMSPSSLGAGLSPPAPEPAILRGAPQAVASPAPRRPARSDGGAWMSGSISRGQRRSEVDRRLALLLGERGRFRDAATPEIVAVLRLFNLCDVGVTGASGQAATPAASPRHSVPASPSVFPPAHFTR